MIAAALGILSVYLAVNIGPFDTPCEEQLFRLWPGIARFSPPRRLPTHREDEYRSLKRLAKAVKLIGLIV
jgi:hypothetical protein